MVATALAMSACGGGSDGPTTTAPSGPPAVRITEAIFQDNGAGAINLTLRNVGTAGTARVVLYWRNPFAGAPIVECALPPDFQALATWSGTRTFRCDPNGGVADWAVVQTRNSDGSWSRTACAARVTPCPATLTAER